MLYCSACGETYAKPFTHECPCKPRLTPETEKELRSFMDYADMLERAGAQLRPTVVKEMLGEIDALRSDLEKSIQREERLERERKEAIRREKAYREALEKIVKQPITAPHEHSALIAYNALHAQAATAQPRCWVRGCEADGTSEEYCKRWHTQRNRTTANSEKET